MNWTRIFFFLLIAVVIIFCLLFYSPVLAYLLLSIVFSYILDPLVTWLEFKKIPRWLSVILVYIVIAGLIVWLSATYIPRFIEQGNQLIALLEKTDKPLNETILGLPFINTIQGYLRFIDVRIPQMNLQTQFTQLIETGITRLGEIPSVLVKNFQAIVSTIAVVFTIPIFSFFLLKDSRKMRRALMSLVPNKYFELALILLRKVDENVGNYLRAIFLEMLSVGIMSTIALSIVGVPYAILIGIIAGITNIIPYVGPWMGGTIAALAILTTGNPPIMILWMGLAMFLVQALDNYVVYPTVVGNVIRMHPLVVLLTVIAGAYFGGVIWMLISVPLVYMVYSLVKALYLNLKQFRLL